MAKEAFYFSHDSNSRSDEKILKLRLKHGWEGYGIYWALIEMLRDSSTYELECDLDLIAFELRCDKDKLKSIIWDFNLFEMSDSNFFSPSLKRRMEMKEAKSEQARDAARKRWAKRTESESNADALQPQSESNAIKERKKRNKPKEETKKESEQKVYRAFAHLSLSVREFEDLEKEFPKSDIDQVLDDIENYAKNKNYKSLKLTAKSWLKKRHDEKVSKNLNNKPFNLVRAVL